MPREPQRPGARCAATASAHTAASASEQSNFPYTSLSSYSKTPDRSGKLGSDDAIPRLRRPRHREPQRPPTPRADDPRWHPRTSIASPFAGHDDPAEIAAYLAFVAEQAVRLYLADHRDYVVGDDKRTERSGPPCPKDVQTWMKDHASDIEHAIRAALLQLMSITQS